MVFLAVLHMSLFRGTRGSHSSPHMEKCILVGYPMGYKGWLFYNPATKKTMISERAVFNKRSFSGLKKTGTVNLWPANFLPPLPKTVELPNFRGDDDDDSNQPSLPLDIPNAPLPPANAPNVLTDADQPPITPKSEPQSTLLSDSSPHTPEPLFALPLSPVPPQPPRKPKRTKLTQPEPKTLQQSPRCSARESRPPGEWWVVQSTQVDEDRFNHI